MLMLENQAARVWRSSSIENVPGAALQISERRPVPQLFAELELLGNGLITVNVRRVEIIQQTPALANHHQQPAAGTMILLVFLQMVRQMIDALRQQRYLH